MRGNFQRVDGWALGVMTNLAAGAYSWSGTVADQAGNVASNSVSFCATGMTNPLAPVISELNVPDGVELPDPGEMWVQCQVTTNAVGGCVSVNGAEALPLSRSGNVVGRSVSLSWGTNVIVVATEDAGTNLASRVVTGVRGDRYRAELSRPAFGTFANGQGLTASGGRGCPKQ